MAYDFKKLSDVDVVETPAETANVLIEEDGVIKKAPKTAVGGAGEWDAVISITGSDFLDINAYTLTYGTYGAIKAKLLVDDVPKIKVVYINEDDNGQMWHEIIGIVTMQVSEAEDSWLWICLSRGSEIYWVAILNDNTITTD